MPQSPVRYDRRVVAVLQLGLGADVTRPQGVQPVDDLGVQPPLGAPRRTL